MSKPDVPMPADRFPYEMPVDPVSAGTAAPTPEKPARKNNRLTRSQERQLEDWLNTFDYSTLATCVHSQMAAHWNGGTDANGNPPAFCITKHNIASALAVLGVKPADEKAELAALTARVTALEAIAESQRHWADEARISIGKMAHAIDELRKASDDVESEQSRTDARFDKLEQSINAISNHPKLV